jgi:transposase
MCRVRFTLTSSSRKAVERHLQTAQHQGRLRQVTYGLALLAVGDGTSFAEIAVVFRIHEQTGATWVRGCWCDGLNGAPRHQPTGRPPKLTPMQKAELATLMDAGPIQAGCRSACWRSPMLQQLRCDRFGVFSNVFYMAQLLKHLGLSYPKAAFVSAHLEAGKRHAWCPTTGPLILRLAHERQARLVFGAEASCPPWRTLAYTWARRGHHPMVKTAGTRTGDNVFGASESCTGRFWYQGQEGRLNSEAYSAFLPRVLAQVTHPIMLIHEGAR